MANVNYKMTPEAHKALTDIQGQILQATGKRPTISEVIVTLAARCGSDCVAAMLNDEPEGAPI